MRPSPAKKAKKKNAQSAFKRVLFAALALCAIVALSAGMTTLLQPPNLDVLAEPTDSAPLTQRLPLSRPSLRRPRSMRPLAHSMVTAAQTSSPKHRPPIQPNPHRFRPLNLRLRRLQKPHAH